MSRSIEHSSEFGHPLDQVLSAFAEEDSLRARLAEIGGHDAKVLSHEKSANGYRYTMRQGIPSDKLPGAIHGLHPGDLMVQREQSWQRVDDSTVNGSATATVSGVPGSIRATSKFSANGGRTTLRVKGDVKVNIPLLGGKIERTIAEQVLKLFEHEDAFIAEQLAGGR